MSTDQRQINPEGLLNANTVKFSQALTDRDRNLEPEDMRTRRFGYQPAFQYIEMHPREGGQQTGRIEPGMLTLFETYALKLQNMSVDASDPSGPAVDGESLAGVQVANWVRQYGEFGFGEIVSLRGLSNADAVDLFFQAHPPLSFAVHEEIRRPDGSIFGPCIYEGEDVDPRTGLREVCITCRRDLIDALLQMDPEPGVRDVLLDLKDKVRVGRLHMASDWSKVLSELNTAPTPNTAPTLGALREGHYYFMRQLHERTPEALALEKSRQATIDTANIFKQAIGQQTAALTEQAANTALEAVQLQMAEQQRQMDQLRAQMSAKPVTPPAPPAAESKTEEVPPAPTKKK